MNLDIECKKFEAICGSYALLKAAISSLNKILVNKGVITEEELCHVMQNELICSFADLNEKLKKKEDSSCASTIKNTTTKFVNFNKLKKRVIIQTIRSCDKCPECSQPNGPGVPYFCSKDPSIILAFSEGGNQINIPENCPLEDA